MGGRYIFVINLDPFDGITSFLKDNLMHRSHLLHSLPLGSRGLNRSVTYSKEDLETVVSGGICPLLNSSFSSVGVRGR